MTAHYAIRSARSRDLETIVAFTLEEAREAEGVEHPPETVRRGVAAGLEEPSRAAYFVAECADGAVVASTSVVREWSDWRAGYYWWIQSLFIDPAHRGRGLVEQLLDHLEAEAAKAGAVDLRLYAHSTNTRALAVYRRCGFKLAPYTIMTRSIAGLARRNI
jgi:ribosomal protein S18 acetylase RimI-like enzyme